jgi:hypothetical protein
MARALLSMVDGRLQGKSGFVGEVRSQFLTTAPSGNKLPDRFRKALRSAGRKNTESGILFSKCILGFEDRIKKLG